MNPVNSLHSFIARVEVRRNGIIFTNELRRVVIILSISMRHKNLTKRQTFSFPFFPGDKHHRLDLRAFFTHSLSFSITYCNA